MHCLPVTKYLASLYNADLTALHIEFQTSPHSWLALTPRHKGCASSRPSSHFKPCDTIIWSWERQKNQLCPKTKHLKTSMLSVAGKHLKTCSSLRNNRNYIAQLSIANPKDLRLFTWRKARVWNFRSDLTAPNHKSVRKTEHPVFQETLHMWEIKFSQARTSDFQACGGLPGYSGKLKKNSEHACLSQIVIPMCLSPKSHKYLLLLSFDSLHCISSMSLKVWLSTAYISSLREIKNGFYT